mmetsp:Transcript_14288/g.53793  ORF Transcript_14288/g.53793 Transcript_14288/m.53793 type:complete len:206 (+) Transcript_14288:2956-3573(+)
MGVKAAMKPPRGIVSSSGLRMEAARSVLLPANCSSHSHTSELSGARRSLRPTSLGVAFQQSRKPPSKPSLLMLTKNSGLRRSPATEIASTCAASSTEVRDALTNSRWKESYTRHSPSEFCCSHSTNVFGSSSLFSSDFAASAAAEAFDAVSGSLGASGTSVSGLSGAFGASLRSHTAAKVAILWRKQRISAQDNAAVPELRPNCY